MVAVGTNAVMYSETPDVEWTLGTALAGSWNGLANSPTLKRWVKCSIIGATRSGFSTDGGDTWSASATPLDATKAWQSIAWSTLGNQFVAVASSGGLDTQRIATSPDGNVWTTLTHLAAPNLRDIIEAPEIGSLFAVGSALLVSTDGGNTWSAQPGAYAPFGALTRTNLAWDGERLYAGNESDVTVVFAGDAIAPWGNSAVNANGFRALAVGSVFFGLRTTLSAGIRAANKLTMTPFTVEVVDGRAWRDVIWSTRLEKFIGVNILADGSAPVFASPTGLAGSFTFPTVPAPGSTTPWSRIREGIS